MSNNPSQTPRLYFRSDLTQSSLITEFRFNNTNILTCIDVDVFIGVSKLIRLSVHNFSWVIFCYTAAVDDI